MLVVTKKPFVPTAEQEAIMATISAGQNCMIKALAGCAKTTSLTETLKVMRAGPSILLLAFNRKNKDEFDAKIAEEAIPGKITVKTMNGLGHGAIMAALGGQLKLDDKKLYQIARGAGLRGDDLANMVTLVRAAKNAGIVPAGYPGRGFMADTDENWEDLCDDLDIPREWVPVGRKLLIENNVMVSKAKIIDYQDQIYYSVCVAGRFPRFERVFVDEAQDLSPMNHSQVERTLMTTSQLVAVGDPNQAIYAWRGADSSSMDTMRRLRGDWQDRKLTETFRCPRLVVERQHGHVPDYRAAASNLEGNIQSLKEWSPEGGVESAVLCRNNAPLLKLAFKCIANGVPVNFAGKDIGPQIKRLYAKLAGKTTDYRGVKVKIDTFLGDPDRDETKVDRYESLLAVLNANPDVTAAMQYLDRLGGQHAVTLSTGHKAKGLEWQNVYHLEPNLIPSKYAAQSGGPALEQEYNLRYVIETRTRNNLYLVQQEGFE